MKARITIEYDEKEIDLSVDILNLLLYNKGFCASSNSVKITGFEKIAANFNGTLQKINQKGG